MHRKPKYHQSEGSGQRDRWLISYTDVVTILLILFVSVAAQGQKARVAELHRDPTAAPKPPAPAQAPATDARASLVELQRKLERPGLDLRLEPRGLVISIPQSVLFSSGDDQVNAHALPALSKIADAILETNNKVALVGHADTVPIHNRRFSNNWQLSAARSLSLLGLLTDEYGIPESRLSIQSYGSTAPLSPNDTEAGRAANRRVEILIMDEK
jgi:chemotaxis protein MotB